MKAFRILSIATAALFFVSCNEGDDTPTPPVSNDGAYNGTVIVAPGTADEYTHPGTEVTIVDNKNETVDIKILKVKFAEKMPAMDITVPGVKLTKLESGGYSISGDNIIPTAAGGPFSQYTVTGLTGTISESPTGVYTTPSLIFSMTCGTYPVSYSGIRSI